MKLVVTTAIAIVLFNSLTNTQTPSLKPQPFKVSSIDTPFAVQVSFAGEYLIYPDRIEVKLTKSDIRVSENCPYKGRRLLSGIRFNLATVSETSWTMDVDGTALPLDHEMWPGDKWTLGETHFFIPLHGAVDLSKHWLVVQIEEISLDAPESEERKGYSFAHSSRDIFLSGSTGIENSGLWRFPSLGGLTGVGL